MDYSLENTIAAVATAQGTAAISVIRLSGKDSGAIFSRVFRLGKSLKPCDVTAFMPETAHYGFVVDASGEIVDEVVAIWFKAPRSYTGEDTVEINCHGGIYVTSEVLKTLLWAGARMAEPGEFSKRAYLNGKMDLTRAEAVMDIIAAQSKMSLTASLGQLGGALYEKASVLQKRTLDLIVDAEANIDYPEYDVPEVSTESMVKGVSDLFAEAEAILATAETGKILREGLKTALVGLPNVGKSSLLNMLLDEDRAIVTDIPGTTRDTLEEQVDLDGLKLVLVDTAGLRETSDLVESQGVDRAKKTMKDAALHLFVLDVSQEISEQEKMFLVEHSEAARIILLNKKDLLSNMEQEKVSLKKKALVSMGACPDESFIIEVSAKNKLGKEELSRKIQAIFLNGKEITAETAMITNLRQQEAVKDARDAYLRVLQAASGGFQPDLLLIDLREAYDALGRLCGNNLLDDISDAIFSRFCLGK